MKSGVCLRMKPKKSVLVILGAGSSVPVVPITSQLTSILLPPDPAVEFEHAQLFAWLQRNIPRGESFESLMAEALRRAEDRATEPQKVDQYLRAVSEGTKAIACEISNRLERLTVKPAIATILEKIAEVSAPLTLGTLNWDDLPLRAQLRWPWYDGYHRGNAFNGMFSSAFLEEYRLHPYRLLWLHGSLHWNRPDRSQLAQQPQEWCFRWNDDFKLPLRAWVQGYDATGLGRLITQFPVIIGPDKPTQLFQRPWFEYWSMLYRDLMTVRSIVFIGYSGADLHLNTLVREAVRYNTNLHNLIWVSFSTCEDSNGLSQELATSVPWVWGETYVGLRGESTKDGFLRILPGNQINSINGWAFMRGVESLARTSQNMGGLIERIIA